MDRDAKRGHAIALGITSAGYNHKSSGGVSQPNPTAMHALGAHLVLPRLPSVDPAYVNDMLGPHLKHNCEEHCFVDRGSMHGLCSDIP